MDKVCSIERVFAVPISEPGLTHFRRSCTQVRAMRRYIPPRRVTPFNQAGEEEGTRSAVNSHNRSLLRTRVGIPVEISGRIGAARKSGGRDANNAPKRSVKPHTQYTAQP